MTKKLKKQRYRKVGEKHLIEVRVKSALQLFDARDPAPFRARDLDDDFTEYVVTSADEFSPKTPLKIMIYVHDKMDSEIDKDAILEAIHSWVTYQIDLKRIQLQKLFKTAQLFLGIGLISLIACLSIANLLRSAEAFDAIKIAKEGVIIFGWVSMWKPFELILFDWYPAYDRIRLFRKLLETEIEVVFEAT